MKKDHFQHFLNGVMADMSEQRHEAAENMRLGAFIEALKGFDPGIPVRLENGQSIGCPLRS